MARTPLFARLQALARKAALEASEGSAGLSHRARRAHREAGPSRREVLQAGGAAGALLALMPGCLSQGKAAASTVVVVGGGLAGLVAAARLRERGVASTVYEAAKRAGGRVITDRETFAGQRVERGGELIDSGHEALRRLVRELDLTLDDLLAAEAPGSAPFLHFLGARYSEKDAEADFAPVFQALQRDFEAAPFPTLSTSFGAPAAALDALSVSDWIETRVPGGSGSRLGRLLDVAYTIEFGVESSEQSALNIVYLLGYGASPGKLKLFGVSDERYRVAGVDDQVTRRLAEVLGDAVRLEHRLLAAATLPDGRTRLVFATPGGSAEIRADRVVMTLPFAVLREDVDLTGLALSPRKRKAIAELGMGTSSKLHLQFSNRPWVALGNNGETFADLGYQNNWEETRAQAGIEGILNNYTGGLLGASLGTGTPEERAQLFLKQIDPLLPGLGRAWNGKASVDFWLSSPYQRGSYSCYRVGQYTTIAGVEAESEGALHFAGEHTSVDFQGYMEGAVESGERAAAEVLAAL